MSQCSLPTSVLLNTQCHCVTTKTEPPTTLRAEDTQGSEKEKSDSRGLKHFTSQRPKAPPWSPRHRTPLGAADRDKETGDRDRPAPLDSAQAGFPSGRPLRTHRPKVTTLTQASPQGCEMDVTPTASKQHTDFTTVSPAEGHVHLQGKGRSARQGPTPLQRSDLVPASLPLSFS